MNVNDADTWLIASPSLPPGFQGHQSHQGLKDNQGPQVSKVLNAFQVSKACIE